MFLSEVTKIAMRMVAGARRSRERTRLPSFAILPAITGSASSCLQRDHFESPFFVFSHSTRRLILPTSDAYTALRCYTLRKCNILPHSEQTLSTTLHTGVNSNLLFSRVRLCLHTTHKWIASNFLLNSRNHIESFVLIVLTRCSLVDSQRK